MIWEQTLAIIAIALILIGCTNKEYGANVNYTIDTPTYCSEEFNIIESDDYTGERIQQDKPLYYVKRDTTNQNIVKYYNNEHVFTIDYKIMTRIELYGEYNVYMSKIIQCN